MLVMVVFFIAFRWIHLSTPLIRLFLLVLILLLDRKSGSAGMPRPISYAVFCLKKKKRTPSLGDSVAQHTYARSTIAHCVGELVMTRAVQLVPSIGRWTDD